MAFDLGGLQKALTDIQDRLRALENRRAGVTQDWSFAQDQSTGALMAVNGKTGAVVQVAP